MTALVVIIGIAMALVLAALAATGMLATSHQSHRG
jgi:hypothetical protein